MTIPNFHLVPLSLLSHLYHQLCETPATCVPKRPYPTAEFDRSHRVILMTHSDEGVQPGPLLTSLIAASLQTFGLQMCL